MSAVIPPAVPSFRPPSSRRQQAFSLVEIVLAVGVVSFAFVAIMGLLPAGMSQFRQAIDTSVCAQIAQRVIMDAQQTDFDALIDETNPKSKANDFSFRGPKIASPSVRYFDEQGSEIIPKNSTSLSAKEKQATVYHVNTRIIPQTALPRTSGFNSKDLATVAVEVAYNPGNRVLSYHGGSDVQDKPEWNLIDVSKTPGVTVITYSAQVGRNL